MPYREAVIAAQVAQPVSCTGRVIDTMTGMDHGRNADAVNVYLDVTEVTGTDPTMLFTVMGVVGDIEYDLAPLFTSVVAAARQVITIPNCPRFIKFKFTIAGTEPAFTWTCGWSRN